MHQLEQAAILLLAAVILVPLFRRLKLGAVLGYLAAGIAIGPWGLGLYGEARETMEVAEFGVVLLLFVIGLELEPRRLWIMRRAVFGLGGAQVLATGSALSGLAMFAGLSWQAALVAGFGLALSSTALVLASLAERGELAERHGRDAFAVLLFQDLAIIPMLALLPLLGASGGGDTEPGWMTVLKSVGAVLAVVAASRLVVRPTLKIVARHGGREIFTAAALLLVIGASLLMHTIGLSMALGAFLAGVLLADSEFRHDLEAEIEPFKGLLLGLFFMAVGMTANLGLLAGSGHLVLGIAAVLMAAKFVVMLAIGRIAGIPARSAERLAVFLCQGGEFAFVLFAAAASLGALDRPTADTLILAVTLSLLASPLLFVLHGRWLERRGRGEAPAFDTIDEPGNPVIIAGYGRVGQIVSRVLRMSGIAFTALEASYQQVDFVRRFGNKVYYGDASRLELLEAAKTGEATLFLLAIDDIEASVRTARVVRRHFPNLPIVARARNRTHYFRLRDLGVKWILRETFPASLDMARQALLRLGMRPSAAERAVSLFHQHDEAQLEAQYVVHHDEAQLIQTAKEAADQLRELFEADVAPFAGFPEAPTVARAKE